MGQKEKLTERLLSKPTDFTFNEAENLLKHFSYKRYDKGKTSGSRVSFISNDHPTIMYRLHPNNELKSYQIKQLIEILKQENLL